MIVSLGNREIVKIGGSDYCLWRMGKGPLIVMLHGWPVTSQHWSLVAPELCKAGYEVCCIDLKGLGESKVAVGSFTKADIANELLTIIDQTFLGITEFSIVGHDWGGSVGLAMAGLSQKVSCLVIEEEIPPGVSVELPEPGRSLYPSWHGDFHRTKPLAETLIGRSQRDYFEFFVRLRCSTKNISASLLQHYLDAYESTERLSTFLEYYRTADVDREFFRKLLGQKIRTSVLGIGGKCAMGSGVFESLKMITEQPEFALFEKSGHYPAEEEPEIFATRITNFLQKQKF